MARFLKRLLGVPEVDLDNILVSFNKTLTDLGEHIKHHKHTAEQHAQAAQEHTYAATVHGDAATKAEGIHANIGALIGKQGTSAP